MQMHVRHETRYVYDEAVSYSIQALKLTPRPDRGQRVLHWRVSAPGERLEQVDPYGNLMQIVTLEKPHRELSIVVEGIADIAPQLGPGPPDPGGLSPLAFLAPTTLTRSDRSLRDLAERCLGRHPPSRRTLLDLAAGIGRSVAYQPGVTDVTHTASEALDLGVGVCQDHAHVLIACCRCVGIPARYVSGYFHTGTRDDVASHAWADVWLGDETGWCSIDVTHGEEAGMRHCRLAVGRDYRDAAPVRGVRRGGGRESMSVTVTVSGGPAAQQ